MKPATVASASDFIRGITFKPHELIGANDPDAIVCMRTKNIQRDLDERNLIAVPSRLVRNEEKLLRAGDILISSANSWELVGKCAYVPELSYRATAGGFIAIVRPKAHTHPRFLYHWLNSSIVQQILRHLGRQTTNISNLDVNRFKELEFPSISLDEQRRLAGILDKADAIRRKRERALALTDDFLRAAYLNLVGLKHPGYKSWEPVAIESLAEDRRGSIRSGPFGSALLHSEFVDEGIAVLGIDNAVKNKFEWAERRYITPEKYEELRRYRVYPKDVIITIMGTTGRSAVVPDDIPEAITTKHLASITCDLSKVLPEVLSFAIHSDPVVIDQIRAANKGAIMDGLNLRIIRQIKLRKPPMRQQRLFADLLQKTHAAIRKMTTPVGEGSELFSSLSQRAFRGEL